MTDDPADNLAELFSAVQQGRRPHMLAARWFTMGVLRAIREGDSLDGALGLKAAGVPSLKRRFLTMRRDGHLCAALRAVALEDGLSDWARCQRLAGLLPGFARAWVHAQRMPEPPADWPTWKCEVFRAAQCGIGWPQSAGGLHALLQRTPPYSLKTDPGNMLARYL